LFKISGNAEELLNSFEERGCALLSSSASELGTCKPRVFWNSSSDKSERQLRPESYDLKVVTLIRYVHFI